MNTPRQRLLFDSKHQHVSPVTGNEWLYADIICVHCGYDTAFPSGGLEGHCYRCGMRYFSDDEIEVILALVRLGATVRQIEEQSSCVF